MQEGGFFLKATIKIPKKNKKKGMETFFNF